MENNAETLPSVGNGGGISQLGKPAAPDLEQLTRDDTWLASVLGEKNAEDADPEHPLRHVLTSVVGTKDDVKPGVREEQLQSGDRFVMCTDGVHGKLDAQSVASVLLGAASAADGASQLVNEAITRGTTDNSTALVINVT